MNMKIDLSQVKYATYICVIPMIASLFKGELLTLLFFFSLCLGFLKQPKKSFQIWLSSVFLLWIIYGVGALSNLIPAIGEFPGDETYLSFGFESFIFMLFLVLLPVFLGRFIGNKFRPTNL